MAGQGMLRHTLLKQGERLEGIYAQAFNRILNQAHTISNSGSQQSCC